MHTHIHVHVQHTLMHTHTHTQTHIHTLGKALKGSVMSQTSACTSENVLSSFLYVIQREERAHCTLMILVHRSLYIIITPNLLSWHFLVHRVSESIGLCPSVQLPTLMLGEQMVHQCHPSPLWRSHGAAQWNMQPNLNTLWAFDRLVNIC